MTACDPLTLTATVTGTGLSGDVVFRDGLAEKARLPIGANGVATFAINPGQLPAATHFFSAQYTGDAQNAPSASARVQVQIGAAPFGVSIDPPNATTGFSFARGAPIPLGAAITGCVAVDIANVQFLANGMPIRLLSAPPFTFSWTVGFEGTYLVTAMATARDGRVQTSAQATITVTAGQAQPGATVVYLHNDAAGNPVAATDAAGAVIWRERFAPFGERLDTLPAAAGNRQWFHGKGQDPETGLLYFGARYYDPTLGRFLSIDPVAWRDGDIHGFNRYGFANNNPYRFTDADGREAEPVDDGLPKRFAERHLTKDPVAFQRSVDTMGDFLGAGLKKVAEEVALWFAFPEAAGAKVVAAAIGAMARASKGTAASFVDLTGHRGAHILNRHRAGAGIAGKTEFPAKWSDQQILHHVSDVATDPKSVAGVGKWNSPYAVGTRDGVTIRVDFYSPDHPTHAGQISTAYPINMRTDR
jgi:RHS repeat-associated protein